MFVATWVMHIYFLLMMIFIYNMEIISIKNKDNEAQNMVESSPTVSLFKKMGFYDFSKLI